MISLFADVAPAGPFDKFVFELAFVFLLIAAALWFVFFRSRRKLPPPTE